jgi:glucose uptake protein GlcU
MGILKFLGRLLGGGGSPVVEAVEEAPATFLFLALAGVSVSLLGWGSFTVPMKGRNLDPMILNLYISVGVFVTSLPILLFEPFAFTWWSTLGAALFAPGCLCCVLAINYIGVAKGQSIWAGMIAVWSFLCGLIGFGEWPVNMPLAIVGGVILLTGIGILAMVEEKPEEDGAEKKVDESAALQPKEREDGQDLVKGLAACVAIALLCGSCMVPFRLSPAKPFQDGVHAIIYAFGFGMSLLPINLIILGVRCLVADTPAFNYETDMAPGVAAGVLWNLGNIGVTYACLPPLGLAIGYPLTQCCLLVAGIWGIFYFQEIKQPATIATFFFGAGVVVVGACILGIYGQSA